MKPYNCTTCGNSKHKPSKCTCKYVPQPDPYDGYCAWHPVGGLRKYTFSKTRLQAEKKMCDVFCNEEIFRKRLKRKYAKGWKIYAIKFQLIQDK